MKRKIPALTSETIRVLMRLADVQSGYFTSGGNRCYSFEIACPTDSCPTDVAQSGCTEDFGKLTS